MKKLIYPAALILLFIILTTTILPADAVYGSNTVTPAWNSTRFFPTGSISEAEAADISFLIMDF